MEFIISTVVIGKNKPFINIHELTKDQGSQLFHTITSDVIFDENEKVSIELIMDNITNSDLPQEKKDIILDMCKNPEKYIKK